MAPPEKEKDTLLRVFFFFNEICPCRASEIAFAVKYLLRKCEIFA